MSDSVNRWDNAVVQHATERSLSKGLPIPVEIFQSSEKRRRPAVIFLYGATGLTPNYYTLINYLAQLGYVIFVPRYLALPGRSWAGPEASRNNFLPWLQVLTDVLPQMTSRHGIDPGRVGLVGISLGASLGVVLASRGAEFSAFVHWIGDVPDLAVPSLACMPPTLVIHGGSDRHVPVEVVIGLALRLKTLRVPCEMRIYPQERHILRPIVNLQAARVTGDFLGKYL